MGGEGVQLQKSHGNRVSLVCHPRLDARRRLGRFRRRTASPWRTPTCRGAAHGRVVRLCRLLRDGIHPIDSKTRHIEIFEAEPSIRRPTLKEERGVQGQCTATHQPSNWEDKSRVVCVQTTGETHVYIGRSTKDGAGNKQKTIVDPVLARL